MGVVDVREAIIKLMLVELNEECNRLCRRKDTPLSPFRTIPADRLVNFTWKDMTVEIEHYSSPSFSAWSPGMTTGTR